MTKSHRALAFGVLLVLLAATVAFAQQPNPASPRSSAATQIGDAWITVDYSSPILRNRQGIFGSGDSYGQKVLAGAPVWRAGADVSTRIKTDADLEIGGKKVPAGEYSFLIDIKEGSWTAIISKQPHLAAVASREDFQKGIADGKAWGGYGYKQDMDVARAAMDLQKTEGSVDNLVYWFEGVSADGGRLGIAWDNHMAYLDFKVAK